ncbi:MAG: hypothetical protein AABN33_18310 [Acidobacteriota bacterium]
MRILSGLWVLAVFSDVFAEALLIWAFWRQRHTSWVGWYWSGAVAGALIESLFSLIVMLSGTSVPQTSMFNILLRMIGRSAKAAGFWAMAIKVLREQGGREPAR